MRRFTDALAIQDGACNPKAIINALKRAIDGELKGADTDGIKTDPAIRLMVHQLAYLTKVQDSFLSLGEYGNLMDECRKEDDADAALLNQMIRETEPVTKEG